jgi:protein O-GlcNAc transferase
MKQNDILNTALKSHLEGALAEAEEAYLRFLDLDPTHAQALHNLGSIYLQRGEHEKAVPFFERAIHQHRAYPQAYNNLGNALVNQGRVRDAIPLFEKALRIKPDYSDACYNLGNACKKLGEPDKAVSFYRRALGINPRDHLCWIGLGVALRELGRQEEAVGAYRIAIGLRQDLPEAHYNLGIVLQELGRPAEAITAYSRAVSLREDYPEAHLNLGGMYEGDRRFNEAILCYDKAIRCRPGYPEAYYNLGFTLEKRGDVEPAVLSQRRALESCPDSITTIAGAAEIFIRHGFWHDAEPLIKGLAAHDFSPGERGMLSRAFYLFNSLPLPAPDLFSKHALWGDLTASVMGERFPLTRSRYKGPSQGARLRIGYVSPDFRRHSVGWFVRNIIGNHDPHRVEVTCYSLSEKEDDVTAEIEASSVFRRVHGKTAREIAGIVYEDRINILVDLAGHTPDNGLDVFALKPAPVQITAIGYPNGTGLREVDYRLSDDFADPVPEGPAYREKLFRMPGCFLPFGPIEVDPRPVGRSDFGIPEDAVVFVSFNALHKLRPEVLSLWNRIMEMVPGAYLLFSFRHSELESIRTNILDAFSDALRDRNRIGFLSWEDTEERHRANYGIADIALDPFPYSGTTTSYEALFMGVPVVTLVGDRHIQRTTYSFLMNLNVQETIASTEEEYVEKAVALASDAGRLGSVRERIRSGLRNSGLCDISLYTHHLEGAFEWMWKRYLKGLEPAEFRVAADDAPPVFGGGRPIRPRIHREGASAPCIP